MVVPRAALRASSLLLAASAVALWQPIKIVSGTPAPVPTPVPPAPPALLREPSPLSGPLVLQTLLGRCFTTRGGVYEYRLCPFANVTQKDVSGAWNAFFGVLGVWDSWLPEGGSGGDVAPTQLYTDGTPCGFKRRQAKARLVCGDVPRLSSVSEPVTCEYSMELEAPEACAGFQANASELLRVKLYAAAGEEAAAAGAGEAALPAVSTSSSATASSSRTASASDAATLSSSASASQSPHSGSGTAAPRSHRDASSSPLRQEAAAASVGASSASRAATASSLPPAKVHTLHRADAGAKQAADMGAASEQDDPEAPDPPAHPIDNGALLLLLGDHAERLSRIERKLDDFLSSSRQQLAAGPLPPEAAAAADRRTVAAADAQKQRRSRYSGSTSGHADL